MHEWIEVFLTRTNPGSTLNQLRKTGGLLALTVIGIISSPGTTAVGTFDLVTFSPTKEN